MRRNSENPNVASQIISSTTLATLVSFRIYARPNANALLRGFDVCSRGLQGFTRYNAVYIWVRIILVMEEQDKGTTQAYQ